MPFAPPRLDAIALGLRLRVSLKKGILSLEPRAGRGSVSCPWPFLSKGANAPEVKEKR